MDPQQQPNQPQTPITPQQTTFQPAVQEMPRKSHKKLALSLLIAPTALFILSLILGIVAAQIGSAPAQDGDLFGEASPAKQILNIIALLSAGVSFLTWLPGLIIGIILLAKKK
jgi:hypothetical protein